MNHHLSFKEYAEGGSFDSAVVGSYLVNIEQPNGTYKFLVAYIDMICAFNKVCLISHPKSSHLSLNAA